MTSNPYTLLGIDQPPYALVTRLLSVLHRHTPCAVSDIRDVTLQRYAQDNYYDCCLTLHTGHCQHYAIFVGEAGVYLI